MDREISVLFLTSYRVQAHQIGVLKNRIQKLMKNGFRCLQMNSDNITLTAKTNNFNLEQNNIHIQTYNIIKH